MPLIVGVMEILKKGKPRIMFPLAIRLYLALWKVENRSYPYLYKMLTSSAVLDEEERWEVYLSKTMAMREICSTAPKLHGKDLVGMLSEVLNLCGDDSNGLPSALAIDSITELCEAHVIDVAGLLLHYFTLSFYSPLKKISSELMLDAQCLMLDARLLNCSIAHSQVPGEPWSQSWGRTKDQLSSSACAAC